MRIRHSLRAAAFAAALHPSFAMAQDNPNILVIWGDDNGHSNNSADTMGVVG
jgi:arylsulfatase